MSLESLVVNWAESRGIMDSGTVEGQIEKLKEEMQELLDAKTEDEFIDAVGDIQVVLIILANMKGYTATACLASAYSEICTRTGSVINGIFVKDADQEPMYSYFEDEHESLS